MRTHPALLLLAVLGACSSQRASAPSVVQARTEPARLPFVEDDYARALSEATARGVPIFVDAWAPW